MTRYSCCTPTRDSIERAINGTATLVGLTIMFGLIAASNVRDWLTSLRAGVTVARDAHIYRWPDGPYPTEDNR